MSKVVHLVSLLACGALAAAAIGAIANPGRAAAQVSIGQISSPASTQCSVRYFGECADGSPSPDARRQAEQQALRQRAQTFCEGLRQAADAILRGQRPGYQYRSDADSWEGPVEGYRLALGSTIGRGGYTYLNSSYELFFFMPSISIGEVREALDLCPTLTSNVTGSSHNGGVLFSGLHSRTVHVGAQAIDNQFNQQTRAFETGVRVYFEQPQSN